MLEIQLTDEQKLTILKRWENSQIPPNITELIVLTWPDSNETERKGSSVKGRIIKEFLTSKNLKAITTEYAPKKDIQLTPEQLEYITNNCSSMKPFEMAKELFKNPRLSPASLECKAVTNFIRTLDPKMVYGEEIPEPDYKPPRRLEPILARIKKYVSSTEDWDLKKLTPTQKKCCACLIHYLHDLRFKRQIDSYEKTEDKITFESEFVKYTYNKTDLEQEDISQYISLCSFVVMEFNIKHNIEMLQTLIESEYDENNRISGNLVEALESARTELNSCSLRQGKLYDALTEKRSDKISKELKDKASLLNLVAAWKQQETRQQIIKLAEERKEKLKKDIHELESLEEIKCRLLGLSVDEILNG